MVAKLTDEGPCFLMHCPYMRRVLENVRQMAMNGEPYRYE